MVLGKHPEVVGIERLVTGLGTPTSPHVHEGEVVHEPTVGKGSDDDPVGATEQVAVVAEPQLHAVVGRVLIDHLKDGMRELLDAAIGHPLKIARAAHLPGGAIGDAPELEVALLVAGDVSRVGLPRVTPELGAGQAARQLTLGVDSGKEEPRPNATAKVMAKVGEYALRVLLGVVAIAALEELAAADEGISVAPVKADAGRGARVAVAAGLDPRVDAGCVAAAQADEVDRAAERGGAEGGRVGAAVDLDVAGGEWLDRLHVEAAVGEVERHTILEQQQAATMEGALQARAADRDARLLGAKARFGEDAGTAAQGIG